MGIKGFDSRHRDCGGGVARNRLDIVDSGAEAVPSLTAKKKSFL
jgi:hypothetical protein